MILVAVVIFMVIVAVAVSTLVILARRPQESPYVKLLRQHAYYTAKAATASRRGKEGEMNVYVEAAKDLDVLEYFVRQALPPAPTPGPRSIGVPAPRRALTLQDVEARIPEHLLHRAREAARKVADQTP